MQEFDPNWHGGARVICPCADFGDHDTEIISGTLYRGQHTVWQAYAFSLSAENISCYEINSISSQALQDINNWDLVIKWMKSCVLLQRRTMEKKIVQKTH